MACMYRSEDCLDICGTPVMPTAGETEDGRSGMGDLPSAEYSFSSSEPRDRPLAMDTREASAAAVAASDSSMVPVWWF